MENFLLGAGIFWASALMDYFCIGWYLSAEKGQAWFAALYSAMIQSVSLFGVLYAVDARWLIIPNILGHAFGSYVGVKSKSQKEEDRGKREI